MPNKHKVTKLLDKYTGKQKRNYCKLLSVRHSQETENHIIDGMRNELLQCTGEISCENGINL